MVELQRTGETKEQELLRLIREQYREMCYGNRQYSSARVVLSLDQIWGHDGETDRLGDFFDQDGNYLAG